MFNKHKEQNSDRRSRANVLRACQQRVGLNTKFRAGYCREAETRAPTGNLKPDCFVSDCFFPSLFDFLDYFVLDCFVRDCFVYAQEKRIAGKWKRNEESSFIISVLNMLSSFGFSR